MDAQQRGPLASYYLLALLLAAYIVSYMDRIALSLMVDPIRRDLGLSDTAISLLIGLAFVLFYSTVGIAMGRLADVGNRPRLIVVGMAIWCLATSASGLATGFGTLLLARILVGFGEAALSPASYSLIASYFPREKLALATSIYTLGVTLGGGLATMGVGLIANAASGYALFGLDPGTEGWRNAFLIVGLAGIPVMFLIWAIRDPRMNGPAGPEVAPSLRDLVSYIRANANAYGPVLGGYAVMAMASLSAVLWGPTYFMRVHLLSSSEVGVLFGFAMGVCGTAGLLTGGWLADRLFRRGLVDSAPRIVIASLLLQTPLFLTVYLSSDRGIATATLVPAVFAMLLQGGLQGATIQLLAPSRMCGLIVSIYLMLANVVGMAIGPFATAFISDTLFGGGDGIGPALAVVTAASSISGAALIWSGLPAYRALVVSQSKQTQ